jgi:hypothetical protein
MVLGLVVAVLIAVFLAQRSIALELRSAYAKLSDTNLLALMFDSSASPIRQGSLQPPPYSPSIASRFNRSSAPVAPITRSQSVAAQESYSLSTRGRALTSSASAKTLRRDRSYNNSSNGSIGLSQPSSPAAAQQSPPPNSVQFSSTTGSTGLASLSLGPKRFASTTGSMVDAVEDLELGASAVIQPTSSEGAKRVLDTLSPLKISELQEQSSSDDWNLRTLREESCSAAASMTASVL